jgi:ribosomal-protein-alanine N-acetyltransferase
MSLPSRDDIVTPRLTLIAITPEMMRSEQANDHRLGELIQCAIPTNWPPIDWEPHVFDFVLAQFDEHPEQIGWHRYVSFDPPHGVRTLIGSLGASSKLANAAECEIGYSILPPFEGRGFATEGTMALIDYLRGNQQLTSVIAHTFPSIPGSIRVMEKCGLTFEGDGEEVGTIRYRLSLR